MSSLTDSKTNEVFSRVDSGFKHRLANFYSGDTLRFCYQCGTCTAACCLSQLISVYRPNKILELASLGIRNIPQSNTYLLCSACTQCTKSCPQGVNVHEVMYALKELASEDEYAWDYILSGLEENLKALSLEIPFPVSYTWVSLVAPSDDEKKNRFYERVKDVLLRSLANFKKEEKLSPKPDADKVAIIGSGPAGLTAAWELSRKGLSVTVFEPLPEAGGMFMVGIPFYRLPKDVVKAEIDNIKAMGVDIKTNTAVDKEFFKNLLDSGEYKSVFVATGAPANRNLRIEGENLEGVVPVLDFLRKFNLNEPMKVGKKVVVIGGGNVGIDAARTAIRCGAESVQLFCLESREEMPSHEWEIQDAIREGVVVNTSWGPKEILGEDNKVSTVKFIRCKSVFDENKRFKPVFDESKTETAEADMVIIAIGQAPSTEFLGKMVALERGAVSVDPQTMKTSLEGVFAGGDTVSGTASLVEAIAAGRVASASIISYLEDSRKEGDAL
ncbi:MAG: FAD-dependent oxidoreductase [Oscillospiraceae bacterium]|nr:FAD-dependent oxidoreductase [Oscillospiraceae bacterium]